jgi:hypothetical protein
MKNSIEEAIEWFDDMAPHLQMNGRIHWQTLRNAVLAAQTNNISVTQAAETKDAASATL